MLSVSQKISNENHVQHLETNPGVGYDCLSLVTKTPDGQWYPNFMLNRNGVNGLANGLVKQIWERSRTDTGIEELANLLIDQTGLSRVDEIPLANRTFQICKVVCDWIAEHEKQNFSVAPPGWPEGCRILNRQHSEMENLEWPREMENRYVVLGIDSREEMRIDLANGSILRNEN
jgi:hypothetical protein